MKPARFRSRGLLIGALALLSLAGFAPAPAAAGSDDFEFGQKLAQNRWFPQARRVFEGMLADAGASEATKDLARYGLANLGYEQARSVAARADAPLAEVVKLAEAAASQVAEFATKNPNHPKASEAKLLSGIARLWLVQWCQQQAESPEALEARKTNAGEVLSVARRVIEEVVSYFEALKGQGGDIGTLAEYHWTMCQYYRAMVYEPCSSQQLEALKQAWIALDDYATNHDGELLASSAHDVMGQVYAAQAHCAQNDTEREQLTAKALDEFTICIDTEYEDSETLKVITNGYYHYGQTCLEIKRIGTSNYLRKGAEQLAGMLARVPNAVTTHAGLRALIVLGQLYAGLGNVDEAVATLKLASDKAVSAGRQDLSREANNRIKETLAKAGGSAITVDVSVLRKVADAFFTEESFVEAISAYRSVISAAPQTSAAFVDFVWPAWERMSACYEKLGDALSAALALEPVFEAWKDGRIPAKDDANDPNMRRASAHRKRQLSLYDQFGAKSESTLVKELYKRGREKFAEDFPKDPDVKSTIWNTALLHLREARDQRKQGDGGWKAKVETARGEFEQLANDPKNDRQDAAYAQLIVADMLLVGEASESVKAAERGLATSEKALAWWASPEGQKKLKDYPQLAGQRQEALVDVRYYRGEFLKALAQKEPARWDDVLKEMTAFQADFANNKEVAGALSLIVEVHLAKGAMDAADGALQDLIKRFPKTPSIGYLVQKVATTFDNQFRELSDRYAKLQTELKGSPQDRAAGIEPRLRDLEQQWNRDTAQLSETRTDFTTKTDQLAAWKKDKSLVPLLTDKGAKEMEEKILPELKKSIATMDARIPGLKAEIDKLSARAEAIRAEMAEIVKAQYRPLREAVKRYQTGLDVQRANDPASVPPSVVLQVATRWFVAAKNPQGVEEDWENARLGFDLYLELPAVKALPASDENRRSAVSKLGRIYAHAADRESDAAKRAELMGKAAVFLESSIADRHENAELVLGLLEGRFAAISWQNEAERDRPTYRFVLPKTDSPDALKAVVGALGTQDSKIGLPVVGDAARQANYRKALTEWKSSMQKAPAGEWQTLWNDLRGGGMDAATYSLLGNTNAEFRLSIAQVYAEQGTDADATKAEALLATLIRGPISVKEYEDDWWEANTLTLRLWISTAERLSKGGAAPAKASELRKRAKQLILGKLSASALPEALRPVWKGLIDQLNKGLGAEGLPLVDADLNKPMPVSKPDDNR